MQNQFTNPLNNTNMLTQETLSQMLIEEQIDYATYITLSIRAGLPNNPRLLSYQFTSNHVYEFHHCFTFEIDQDTEDWATNLLLGQIAGDDAYRYGFSQNDHQLILTFIIHD